ncbi:nucleoside 2-deoxyribosyltransferase [Thalassolituus oleivorans]|uniref:nucleoside 2-deoxyribosyltransferase n=1 Tax=Thalassolituus oleivorans TaxID=187493 RepID=UPI001CE248D6|nr:nucleoside 2-deoxyribosyltransferase [Thalassolituus oleivorans]
MSEDEVQVNQESSEAALEDKRKRRKATRGSAPRPIPVNSLEDSIAIPQALKEYNGSNPWTPADLANVLEMGAKANKFYYLTASSRDYGLTSGTSRSGEIELTNLANDFLFAPSPTEEFESLQKAFFKIDLFKKVFDYYSGGDLPEMKYLGNTLQGTFGLDPEFHDEFYNLYNENLDYIGRFKKETKSDIRLVDQNKSEHLVVTGSPKSVDGDLKVAFVAMPFSEKTGKYPIGFYKEVMRNLVTPAGVQAGFKVETARKDGSDIIHSTIVNDLLDADLVIADLTDHNPNVLFELGVRMAHNKPVALIRAEGTGQIFDVDNLLRVYDYSPNLWPSTLEEDIPNLVKHIKATWENRDSNASYMKILRGKEI